MFSRKEWSTMKSSGVEVQQESRYSSAALKECCSAAVQQGSSAALQEGSSL